MKIPIPSSVQIAIAALVVILMAGAWMNYERLMKAEQRARVAETQAELNAAAVQQLDHYTTTTTVIREKAQEAERVVQSAPGANAPLDPDNRSVVCAELERMRGSAVCTD